MACLNTTQKTASAQLLMRDSEAANLLAFIASDFKSRSRRRSDAGCLSLKMENHERRNGWHFQSQWSFWRAITEEVHMPKRKTLLTYRVDALSCGEDLMAGRRDVAYTGSKEQQVHHPH